MEDWFSSLTGLFSAPESAFWWPGLLLALAGAVWFGRDRRLWGRSRDYWRELPVDAGCFLANSTLPFLLAPFFFALGLAASRVGAGLATALTGVPPLDAPGWPLLLFCAGLAFVAGDLALYGTHRLFHAVPILWKAHRLHHAPPVLTPLTAYRFWPWEQAMHMSANMLAQGLALGLSAGLFGAGITPLTLLGVNIFALAWGAGFTHLRHSPVPMPYPRWLSGWLISPHMHQLHHSMALEHRDRNFGTALAVWDRLFGTLVRPDATERFHFGAAGSASRPSSSLDIGRPRGQA
ncbi:sterol desaturase family protein [Niveispirillum fermenti]|uniref:sterol desaturase family protein n=1 Tax=Niveispirillum fermenti TaxID=1233113 RepID=UPI003A851E78